MKNPKKPARLPRKAPSNQTGGTAWGKKLAAEFSRMVQSADAAETEVADRPRQPVNYAGRVAERTADNVRKPSVLAQLHTKQAERSAEPQKSQKRKSHEMEL